MKEKAEIEREEWLHRHPEFSVWDGAEGAALYPSPAPEHGSSEGWGRTGRKRDAAVCPGGWGLGGASLRWAGDSGPV